MYKSRAANIKTEQDLIDELQKTVEHLPTTFNELNCLVLMVMDIRHELIMNHRYNMDKFNLLWKSACCHNRLSLDQI